MNGFCCQYPDRKKVVRNKYLGVICFLLEEDCEGFLSLLFIQ